MENSEILNEVKRITGKPLRCMVPFTQLQLFADGNAYGCCPSLVNKYSFGNLLEKDYEEIWHGEKANEFRQSVLDGSYKFCNLASCVSLNCLQSDSKYNSSDEEWEKVIRRKNPKEVHLNIDVACNVCCVTCRDKYWTMPEADEYAKIIDTKILPLLQDAEMVYLNGTGELFASKLCRNLVKKITSQFPKIRFNIITNGILADEKNLTELGLINRINSVEVSVHASTKETYDKIVKGGNFDRLMENLKYLSELKKQGAINFIWLNFVVTVYNYKELIDFQKFADKLDVNTRIWEYRIWGNASLDKHYDEVAVFEPNHPEYPEFVKIISNKIFENPNCDINNKLRPLSQSGDKVVQGV
ncbi:MAG: SPASM domain-containing protein [Candidatus Gastranaerophilales bacterium]|nr:SPASM domain-containing protein [Candidatus Gastranaerophilales bacterium]